MIIASSSIRRLGGVALLLAAGVSAPARPAAEPPASTPAFSVFAALDLNRDGRLDAAELSNAGVILAALDTNDDGLITADELGTSPVSRRGSIDVQASVQRTSLRWSPAAALLGLFDANADGVLQPLEVMQAGASLGQLDRNGDGVVSRDDLRANPRV